MKEMHTLVVLVDNLPGVLARVVGLFSGRGYNIESLTVSSITDEHNVSRINIVTSGTSMVIDQIKAQLARLVPVHEVYDLTTDGPSVEKELALIKLVAAGAERRESLRIADIFKAKVADTTAGSFVFQLEGSSGKLNAFVDLMNDLGQIEVARSGVVAISRGTSLSLSSSQMSKVDVA
ncbi:MAG: acetolactate synthase small subunit [Alphaproteobacteria bacterium]|nr:acetolactate synthase small subunit [Alphaproteobacteria bacterium]